MKDYYRILGIVDDAEDIVIRAAYKALTQRYSSDKWSGDKKIAAQKILNISEAFGVLTDSQKKKKYDKEYFKNKLINGNEAELNDELIEFDKEENQSWTIACDFFKSIEFHYLDLKKYNAVLANTYRFELLATQKFDNSFQLRSKYERKYLSRHYGNNQELQCFAKFLTLSNNIIVATRLSKLIATVGDSIESSKIMDKIFIEFKEIDNLNFSKNIEKLIIKLFNQNQEKNSIYEITYLFERSNEFQHKVIYDELKNEFMYMNKEIIMECSYDAMISNLQEKYLSSYESTNFYKSKKIKDEVKLKVSTNINFNNNRNLNSPEIDFANKIYDGIIDELEHKRRLQQQKK